MRNYEFFALRFENEIPAFVKVLRALPADKLDYRPHEKNTPAGALAWQIATEAESLAGLFENGVVDYRQVAPPASLDEIVAAFERGAAAVVERARKTSDELWKGKGQFLWDGNVAWQATAADIAWGFLFDMVHHRGQLTVYIRPMGGKVPAVYGPSADDPGGS